MSSKPLAAKESVFNGKDTFSQRLVRLVFALCLCSRATVKDCQGLVHLVLACAVRLKREAYVLYLSTS